MSTFLLPSEPIESLDAYLATDTGGSGVRRALPAAYGKDTASDVVDVVKRLRLARG